MPMDFPNLDVLRRFYDSPKALPYREGETEASYRERCAVHAETVYKDPVEAMEIRSSKGWDKWDDKTTDEAVKRHPDPASNPMLLTKMADRLKKSPK